MPREISEPLGCIGVWRLQLEREAWDLQQSASGVSLNSDAKV